MAQTPKTIGSIERLDPAFDKLVPAGAKIEVLGEGFDWSEGVCWVKDGGYAGTRSVPVKISPQAVPRSYKCALFIVYKEGERTLTAAASRISDPDRAEYQAQFRRAPESPFLGEVSGPFAR